MLEPNGMSRAGSTISCVVVQPSRRPGVSRFFSPWTTLMRLFAKDSIQHARKDRHGCRTDPASMVTKAIERKAQKRREQNSRSQAFVEYDDVLNEQRNYIYGQRNDILLAEDLISAG